MALVYVTGTSGVGKTVVGEELERRGFTVYDVDLDGLARLTGTTRGTVRAWFRRTARPLRSPTGFLGWLAAESG